MLKRKYNRRISVWTLVFALMICVLGSSLLLPAQAKGMMGDMGAAGRGVADLAGDVVRDAGDMAGDAVRGVGDAAGDAVRGAGNAAGDAVDDVMDMNASEGRVRDSDGKIGNEPREGAVDRNESGSRSGAWLGWVIAVVVALIILTMIVVLIPKKRTNE